jgi:hypothetical protein
MASTVFGSLGMSTMQFVIANGTKKVHGGHLDRARFLASHLEAIRDFFASNIIQLTLTPRIVIPNFRVM